MVDAVKQYLKHPEWRKQLRWRRAIWRTMARVGLTGVHALPLNRRWVDIHRRKMAYPTLDPKLAGLRIVQISDLHYSPVVWKRYLQQYLHWVNEMEPDLVVITGDLITGGYRYAPRIAHLLKTIQSRYGVICTFGNHDYSMYGKKFAIEGKRRADYLEDCLQDQGLIVLRNEVMKLHHNGSKQPLMIVGLDDEWSGNIDPEKGFSAIDGNDAVLCLNHNPANAVELLKYNWHWMLAGHTHGRQLGTSAWGRRFYGHLRREYTHGYYCVHGRHLYVNRGLSYGQRVLDWCRPEVTVFKLTSENNQCEEPSAD